MTARHDYLLGCDLIVGADPSVTATTGGKYDWVSVTKMLYEIQPMTYRMAGQVAQIAGRVIQEAIAIPVHQGAAVDVLNVVAPGSGVLAQARKVDLASMQKTAGDVAHHAGIIAEAVRAGRGGLPYPGADDLRRVASKAFIEYNAEAETQLAARDRLAFWQNVGESLQQVLDEVRAAAAKAAGKVVSEAGKLTASVAWAAVKPVLPWVAGGAIAVTGIGLLIHYLKARVARAGSA